MRKIQRLQSLLTVIMIVLCSGNLSAQSADSTITLDPAMFMPADTGYYVDGVEKDLDGDGSDEFYNGCADAYGDSDHREAGSQHGWEYKDVIIFNDCDTWEAPNTLVQSAVKGQDDQPEGWPANWDFIQITKLKAIDKLDKDSTTFGYIKSPAFTNLKSLQVMVSTDNSINPGRDIFMLIEASRDGETWAYLDTPADDELLYNAYIIQKLGEQGGNIINYAPGHEQFENILKLSEDANSIYLRIVSFPDLPRERVDGERLNIWGVKIVVEKEPEDVLAVEDGLKNAPFIIRQGEFIAKDTKSLYVYNLSGILVGEGKRVGIPCKGLYVVKTAEGYSKKLYIK